MIILFLINSWVFVFVYLFFVYINPRLIKIHSLFNIKNNLNGGSCLFGLTFKSKNWVKISKFDEDTDEKIVRKRKWALNGVRAKKRERRGKKRGLRN